MTRDRLPLPQAIALGLLQGPAELLPISSSGHLVLVPALLHWSYGELDDELRKSFEVALHAGTAVALLIALRHEVGAVLRGMDGGRLGRHALTFLPPAVAAFLFERPIEERLGSPHAVAGAQVAAGAALAFGDLAPAGRSHEDAGAADAFAIGVAQACALWPGVSRNGATLTAARLLRFERPAANRLSRHAALPIILAAAGLKGLRLWRRGLPPGLAVPFAVGAAASFCSTLASTRLVAVVDEAPSYAPFGAYRVLLGVVAWRRLSTAGLELPWLPRKHPQRPLGPRSALNRDTSSPARRATSTRASVVSSFLRRHISPSRSKRMYL